VANPFDRAASTDPTTVDALRPIERLTELGRMKWVRAVHGTRNPTLTLLDVSDKRILVHNPICSDPSISGIILSWIIRICLKESCNKT